jgi:hypothetical protein
VRTSAWRELLTYYAGYIMGTFWSARRVPVFGRPQAANRMLLLRNTRKTECGANLFLIRLAVRADTLCAFVDSYCTASVTAGRELA